MTSTEDDQIVPINNLSNFKIRNNVIEKGKDCGICIIGPNKGEFMIDQNKISSIQRDGIVIKQQNATIIIQKNQFENNGNNLKIWTKDDISENIKIPENIQLTENNITENDVQFWKWRQLNQLDMDKLQDELKAKFDQEVLSALVFQVCTRSITKQQFHQQPWYECLTCGLKDQFGVCYICARTCHKGHKLLAEKISNFYCDCGSKGGTCRCYNEEL